MSSPGVLRAGGSGQSLQAWRVSQLVPGRVSTEAMRDVGGQQHPVATGEVHALLRTDLQHGGAAQHHDPLVFGLVIGDRSGEAAAQDLLDDHSADPADLDGSLTLLWCVGWLQQPAAPEVLLAVRPTW